ncbi:MAG: hypothetical protein KQH83_03225 [Actinobacteria bacterium]|nr:hypothetical protein [Actinomycetota bacterium]
MKINKLWKIGLAAVLAWWGLMLLDVLTFSGADNILAIASLATAFLVLIDK